jgi:formate dehydrogenase iron-sulfur subunit
MARARVGQLHEAGENRAHLYGADETMLGGLNSFYLLVDKPEAYGLPPDPRIPSRNLRPSAFWSTLGALVLTIMGVFHFRERGRRDA